MKNTIIVSDKAQEILEKYWIETKEKDNEWKLEYISENPISLELISNNYAKIDNNKIVLTDKGWDEARSCVRRHRLAERLLCDVLDIKKDKIHEIGCEFEHVLQRNVEENICILLGHPNRCPHGRPIPEGRCCKNNKLHPKKMVTTLSEFELKKKGQIAYIKAKNERTMNKLTAMGILPGQNIELLRKSPSFLFQMGESQFAIDKNLADTIYVRLI